MGGMDMDEMESKAAKEAKSGGMPCAAVAAMLAKGFTASAETCMAKFEGEEESVAVMFQMASWFCCNSMASVCEPFIVSPSTMCNADQMDASALITMDEEDGPMPCNMLRAKLPKFTLGTEGCYNTMTDDKDPISAMEALKMVAPSCCKDGVSACTAFTTTTTTKAADGSAAAPVKETTMDATVADVPVDTMAKDFVETAATKAAESFAAATGVAPEKVKATAKTVVKTQVQFNEDVTATKAKTIMAKTTGLAEDKVTVTEVTRRLGNARRLTGKKFDVKLEVTSTEEAKSVATAAKDTAKIVEKAAAEGVTITPPTVAEPKVDVEVKYTVAEEVAAPTTEELTKVGKDLGSNTPVTVSNVVVDTKTTSVAPTEKPASSAMQQFGSNAALIFLAVAMMAS